MLDIIVFSPHPDDAELSCGGAIIKATKIGLKVGIIDFTAGELGTRGDSETRLREAKKAQEVMGVSTRENMHFPDSFLEVTKENVLAIANKIRQYKPKIVLIPYWEDRHPDHVATSQIAYRACHYAKLEKVNLDYPKHYVQHKIFYPLNTEFKPSFIMDISDVIEEKVKAILSYESQFKRFVNGSFPFPLVRRSQYYGSLISAKYGEPYLLKNPVRLNDWSLFMDWRKGTWC